jgi:hypothetical protein
MSDLLLLSTIPDAIVTMIQEYFHRPFSAVRCHLLRCWSIPASNTGRCRWKMVTDSERACGKCRHPRSWEGFDWFPSFLCWPILVHLRRDVICCVVRHFDTKPWCVFLRSPTLVVVNFTPATYHWTPSLSASGLVGDWFRVASCFGLRDKVKSGRITGMCRTFRKGHEKGRRFYWSGGWAGTHTRNTTKKILFRIRENADMFSFLTGFRHNRVTSHKLYQVPTHYSWQTGKWLFSDWRLLSSGL